MWDYLLTVGNQISPEDVGDDYFHCLLANSFFQNVSMNKLGDIETCKMHDLVHDLAQSVNSVHDIKIVNSDATESISEFRRLQFLSRQRSKTFTKVLKKTNGLRSLFYVEDDPFGEHLLHAKNLRVVCLLRRHAPFIQSPIRKLRHLRHLRYLDLSYCSFYGRHDISINQLYNLKTLVLYKCKYVGMILVGIGSLKILRHLNLSCSDVVDLPDSVVQLTNLQTLNLQRCKRLRALPVNIGSLKNLRELKLEWCYMLEALPREVGALTRLRCLDLSDTRIQELPESCISNLCNLEIMNFGFYCKLPVEIKNWPKLRILKHDRKIRDEMPRGIETLTCLEVLDCYMVRNIETISCSGGSGSGIAELANLNSLEVLEIHNLEFVRGGIDAERAKLRDKINLRDLCLEMNRIDEASAYEVLEGLEPHPNLRRLDLTGFAGLKLPKWMSSNYLPNLVEIRLGYCRFEKLPALGMFPLLRILSIRSMDSVKCLGEEFYHMQQEEVIRNSSSTENSTAISLFPSLISLELKYMQNLQEWVSPPLPNYNPFPSLEKLEIRECPKLRSRPNSFPALKDLVLDGTSTKTVASFFAIGGLTSLTSILIEKSPRLIHIPVGVLLQNITPNLQTLCIQWCDKFQGFLEDDDLNNYTKDSKAVVSFACPKINTNPNNTSNSLRRLELTGCSVLTLLPDLRSYTSLRELRISGCNKMLSIPYNLRKSLTFLEKLSIDFNQREDS